MVSSPMYERLMQFADSAPENEKLYGWDDEHSTVVKAIRKAQEKVEHFKDHQGFTGQAGDAMSAEAVRALQRFNGQANYYLTGMSYYVEARRAIMLAAEEARQLSPTSVFQDSSLIRLWSPALRTSTLSKLRPTHSGRRSRPKSSSTLSPR